MDCRLGLKIMKNKVLIFLSLAGFIVALDQLVKVYIHTHFSLHESLPVIDGIFHITYVRNLGAAFGFLADSHPDFRTTFFAIVPVIAFAIILYILKGVASTDRWQISALSCIFAGALGNYIDRLKYGFVVDFLDFHYFDVWSYPAFNVADMAIVGGVGCLLILMSRTTKSESV